MLLHIILGATSYGDLRTMDGETHTSFKSACIALGLLADDNEWDSVNINITMGDNISIEKHVCRDAYVL